MTARWIFELFARPYEFLVWQRSWRDHARHLLDRLPEERRPRWILDAGCGPGVSALAMLAASPRDRVVGFDISWQMLRRAAARRQQEGAAVPLVRADVARLPFASDRFDGVTGHSFLYLLPDKPAALGELRRVLRRGGRLVLLEPAEGPGLLPVARSLRHGLRFAASMAAWRVVSRGVGRFGPATLRETLAHAGFGAVTVEPTLDGLGLVAVAEK